MSLEELETAKAVAWRAYDDAIDASWDKYRADGYSSIQSRDQARRDHEDLYAAYLFARQELIEARSAAKEAAA